MTNKPKNQIETDTQPAYDPPQALRMGDIRAGAGGVAACTRPGSGFDGLCQTGIGAFGECLGDGTGAGTSCTSLGNNAAQD